MKNGRFGGFTRMIVGMVKRCKKAKFFWLFGSVKTKKKKLPVALFFRPEEVKKKHFARKEEISLQKGCYVTKIRLPLHTYLF